MGEAQIQVLDHSAKLLDTVIRFKFYFLGGKQILIWVGDAAKEMSLLHFAIPTTSSDFLSTCLLGPIDSPAGDICAKLSKRFKMPVFLSFNIGDPDPNLSLFAQTVIIEYSKLHPELFTPHDYLTMDIDKTI